MLSVGQLVTIRPDIYDVRDSFEVTAVMSMCVFAGRTAEIERVILLPQATLYVLRGLGGYNWTEDMFTVDSILSGRELPRIEPEFVLRLYESTGMSKEFVCTGVNFADAFYNYFGGSHTASIGDKVRFSEQFYPASFLRGFRQGLTSATNRGSETLHREGFQQGTESRKALHFAGYLVPFASLLTEGGTT